MINKLRCNIFNMSTSIFCMYWVYKTYILISIFRIWKKLKTSEWENLDLVFSIINKALIPWLQAPFRPSLQKEREVSNASPILTSSGGLSRWLVPEKYLTSNTPLILSQPLCGLYIGFWQIRVVVGLNILVDTQCTKRRIVHIYWTIFLIIKWKYLVILNPIIVCDNA